MKMIKRISAFLLMLIIFSAMPAFSAFASQMEHEGLEITVEMDKEVYEQGEPITATLTVKNTNSETVIITNLEQLIPEGYVLLDDSISAKTDIELQQDQSVVLKVVFEGEDFTPEEAKVEEFLNNLIFGQTWVIPNILIVLALIIGVILFFHFT